MLAERLFTTPSSHVGSCDLASPSMISLPGWIVRPFVRQQPNWSDREPDRFALGPACLVITPKRRRSYRRCLALGILGIVAMTALAGQRFYNQPRLDVGMRAAVTITAPDSAQVVDRLSTDRRRSEARSGTTAVLRINATTNQQLRQTLNAFLAQGEEVREQLGAFPYLPVAQLSEQTQLTLRQLSPQRWRQLQQALTQPNQPLTDPELQQLLDSLEQVRRRSPQTWPNVLSSIRQAQQRYTRARDSLDTLQSSARPSPFQPELLDLSNRQWQQLQLTLREALDRILAQGLPQGLPEPVIQNTIRSHLGNQLSNSAVLVGQTLLGQVINNQSTLEIDQEKTRFLAELRASAVDDVVVPVRKGQVIVASGEVIREREFALLDYFGLTRRSPNWPGLIGFGGIVTMGLAVFWLMQRRWQPNLRVGDRLLLLVLALSVPLGYSTPLHVSTLPAVGLLAGSFYGARLGSTLVVLLTAIAPLGLNLVPVVDLNSLMASSVAGLVGAVRAGSLRSREEVALLGLGVGMAEGVTFLLCSLINPPAGLFFASWISLLTTVGIHALRGMAWSVVALGISPYLERIFDLVTPIRLAELANPNRPLLRRLAAEAPGTFQHTLFVSSLAEAAARALGCNMELVRTGTLYHDVGKLCEPCCFVENQQSGKNQHDQINDPWQSAAIIQRHVSEGVQLARRAGLPKAVRDFIPEHQGTMLIAYFYHQAKELAQKDPDRYTVNEQDFRYPGPIPQSRETGIVMLADSCEAALRSLENATMEDALRMVKRIIRARWQDNQLAASGLSRRDLATIAEVFVQIWQQFHHKRIAYPSTASN